MTLEIEKCDLQPKRCLDNASVGWVGLQVLVGKYGLDGEVKITEFPQSWKVSESRGKICDHGKSGRIKKL